jgi:hypothetical protein
MATLGPVSGDLSAIRCALIPNPIGLGKSAKSLRPRNVLPPEL